MILKPGSLQSRILALLLLGLMITLVVAATVVPVWTANRHFQDTIDGMQGRLEQLQRAAAIGASLQPQHEQLTRWRAGNTHFLKSDSATLASAELQRLVKRIAGANGAEVLSTQIIQPREEQTFTQVTIKVRMRTSLDKLVQVFHALETGEPYLFLNKVSVHGRLVGRGKVGRGPSLQRVLDVDFELIGYLSQHA